MKFTCPHALKKYVVHVDSDLDLCGVFVMARAISMVSLSTDLAQEWPQAFFAAPPGAHGPQ